MHSHLHRFLASFLIFACAAAWSQDSRSVLKLVYDDCMAVMVIEFQADEKVTNPAVAAHAFCEIAVRCLSTRPATDCRRGIASYDLKRNGAGASALYEASHAGNAAIVGQLIGFGFDPNAQLSGPGWTGWTPLMIATAENHQEAVRILLEGGANPNARNDLGRTSLMFASSYGNEGIVAMLLAQGADPNVVPGDETAWTALMAAAANGHAPVIRLLLDGGADSSMRNLQGQSALDLAESNGHSESARVLRDWR